MPKIYTKYGDQGQTFLPRLGKISKSHELLEVIGIIDELNCHIGLLRSNLQDTDILGILLEIQKDLFVIGARLADDKYEIQKKPEHEKLEKFIDNTNDKLPPLVRFVLPGGSLPAAQAHICRSLSRKFERTLARANEKYQPEPKTLVWINRLSDFFFILARSLNYTASGTDITWDDK